MRVVVVEKRNSLAFASAMLDAYESDLVALPLAFDKADEVAGISIEKRIECALGGGWLDRHVAPRHDDLPAQISLTSGTTGKPKSVVLSHRALGSVTSRLTSAMSMNENVREYIGVPVTYSFGMGRIRAVASVGGRSFIPNDGFRADELARMLGAGEINSLALVPTLLRVVLSQRDFFADCGAKLLWLEIGSQAMSGTEKEMIRELFPNAQILQHYGLTEASRTTFLDVSNASAEVLESVGAPTGEAEIRIDDHGLICIRGPHVADGILTADGIEPLVDADGWLTTRDLGRLIDGNLRYLGRADDQINMGGVKISSEHFEEELRSRTSISTPFAVAPGHDQLRGQVIVIAHQGTISDDDRSNLDRAASLLASEMNVRDGTVLFEVQDLPLTETGKVQRGEIGKRFDDERNARGSASVETAPLSGNDPATIILATFTEAFGEGNYDDTASFISLEGDSLNYIAVAFGVREALGYLPEDWSELSISALISLAQGDTAEDVPKASEIHLLDNLDTLRAIACILVVMYHVVGSTDANGLRFAAGEWPRRLADSLEYVRMPLFTAMAGFLYAALPATRDGFWDFFARRSKQLLIPMFFVMLVMWIGRAAQYGKWDDLGQALYHGYQHLWYIYSLMSIFVIVAVLDIFVSKRPSFWAAVLVTAPIIGLFSGGLVLFSVGLGIGLLPYFALGVLLFRQPAILNSRALLAASGIAAVAGLTIQQLTFSDVLNLGDWERLVRYTASCAIVLVLIRYCPRIHRFEALGIYTFTIYLWHPLANGAIRSALGVLHVQNKPLLFVVGTLAGLLLPVLLYRIMTRLPAISLPFIGR